MAMSKYLEAAKCIAEIKNQRSELEAREKELRAVLESKYPSGTPMPEDFPLDWQASTTLKSDKPEKLDPTVTKTALDTKKAKAYRDLHGKLPKGVEEVTSYSLVLRK